MAPSLVRTQVMTEDSLIPIEDIEPGDLVWATDEETGETALKEVVQLFRNETDEWVHVTVNGEEITCTPTHPFYVPQKGWISAIDLRAGDILVMLNGEYVIVEQVQHELLESSEITYNFEVEGYHTYYVGNSEILVHNLGCNKKELPIKENGVTIESYYPDDHGNPVHLHVNGGGRSTKIGPQGYPVKGSPELSPQQSAVVRNNINTIKRVIRKLQREIRKR